MKVRKVLLNAAFFIFLISAAFSQEQKTKSFFDRKFDDEFSLQSSFSFSGAYNLTSVQNYPCAKVSVDLVEAWFGRLGVASVLGFSFGMLPDSTELITAQLICPGLNASWDIGSGLYASLGINLLHTWYVFSEEPTAAGQSTTATTTLRSYGFSIPLKVRYAITRQFSVLAEYTLSAHPWIPASTTNESDWIAENTLSAGVSFSIPHTF